MSSSFSSRRRRGQRWHHGHKCKQWKTMETREATPWFQWEPTCKSDTCNIEGVQTVFIPLLTILLRSLLILKHDNYFLLIKKLDVTLLFLRSLAGSLSELLMWPKLLVFLLHLSLYSLQLCTLGMWFWHRRSVGISPHKTGKVMLKDKEWLLSNILWCLKWNTDFLWVAHGSGDSSLPRQLSLRPETQLLAHTLLLETFWSRLVGIPPPKTFHMGWLEQNTEYALGLETFRGVSQLKVSAQKPTIHVLCG